MEELLDDINNPVKPKRFYSILSALCSGVNLGLVVYYINSFPSKLMAQQGISEITFYVAQLLKITILLGMFFTIMSIMKKERLPYFRMLGCALNSLLFLAMLMAIWVFV